MGACVLADCNSAIYELCSWEADPSSLKTGVHSGRSLCAAGFLGKPHIRTKNAIPVTARDHLNMDMRGWRGRRMAEYIFEASRDAGRARDQRWVIGADEALQNEVVGERMHRVLSLCRNTVHHVRATGSLRGIRDDGPQRRCSNLGLPHLQQAARPLEPFSRHIPNLRSNSSNCSTENRRQRALGDAGRSARNPSGVVCSQHHQQQARTSTGWSCPARLVSRGFLCCEPGLPGEAEQGAAGERSCPPPAAGRRQRCSST